MTDDTGILQHAIFAVPRYADGYCLDDNARALLLMTMLEETRTESVRCRARARVAVPGVRQPRLRPRARSVPLNFMDYSRRWIPEESGSEDCHGRALWALGVGRRSVVRRRHAQSLAGNLFHAALLRAARSRARAPGPTRCSGSTSTCARSRATAACRRSSPSSPRSSSRCSEPRPRRTGRGSRTG